MNLAHTIPLADTWMHGGSGWGWMSLMMVVMVLFWGAVIFGIVWLIRGASQNGSAVGQQPTRKESPLEILDRRFAEGEITEEDYRARRGLLRKETTAAADGAPVAGT
jgi:putative membrane protein